MTKTDRWNCLKRSIIERKIGEDIEVAGRRGKRHKKLLDDREKTRGY
jgi:hypothetical protein